MPPLISVFLDIFERPDYVRREVCARWIEAFDGRRDVELLLSSLPRDMSLPPFVRIVATTPVTPRAERLHQGFGMARGEVFAWLDPEAPLAPDVLASAIDDMRSQAASAIALTPPVETLTPLGVRVRTPDPSAADVLFAPEGAAIYLRAHAQAVGGFPAALIYGHEDADLGWRLALHGKRTIVSRHPPSLRPDAGGSRFEQARALRHRTANELATLFVCAGDARMHASLAAALARLQAIAAMRAGLEPRAFDFGAPLPSRLELPVEAVALLLAVEDFGRRLPALQERRREVQRLRQRDDAALASLFDARVVDDEWERASGDGAPALCRMLGLGSGRAVASSGLGSGRAVASGLTLSTSPDATARPDPNPPDATARPDPSPISATGTQELPRVSIVILTMLGPKHLPACLESLARLDYPSDHIEVIVVDNASADDPRPVVAQHYPAARVLRQDRNLGFCGGNNVGAEAAQHEWLFFLNDDTRVDPGLLKALAASANTHRAVCIGAFVVDWDGKRVDFAGGGVNFEGRGFQHGVGARDLDTWRQDRPLLFANGAAVMIQRDAYFAAGGFPDEYFAYYEDVALGWALWVRGQDVWLSPRATVYHRHHGTSASAPSAARERNCERNAFYTLLTHMADESLPDLLAAGLVLAGTRVVLGLGLGGFRDDSLSLVKDHRLGVTARLHPLIITGHLKAELLRRGASRQQGLVNSLLRVGAMGFAATARSLWHLIRWGGPPRTRITLPARDDYPIEPPVAATLVGVAEWCRQADKMEDRRQTMQQQRVRSDTEVISRFSENWLDAIPVQPLRQAEYNRAHRNVADAFDLARFARP